MVAVIILEPTRLKRTRVDDPSKVRTNITLYAGSDQVNMVREVWILVQGSGLTSLSLAQKLQSLGLGDRVWSGVQKLLLDTSRCTAKGVTKKDMKDSEKSLHELNDLLSAVFPSLSEISFLGPGADKPFHSIPINPLINECLSGSQPLRVLRISSDIHPDLTSHLSTPIQLTCLDINTIEMEGNGSPLTLPPLLASTLVELRLGSVYVNQVWEPFEASSEGGLVFASLKSLTLCFSLRRGIQPRHPNAVKYSMGSEDEDWWGEEDDGLHGISDSDKWRDVGSSGYMESKRFGTPQFPVLASLEIRRFSRDLELFMTLFEDCPLTSLSLWSLKGRMPEDLDLSSFDELRSLSVRFVDVINEYDDELIGNALSSIFTTANRRLQSLTLMIHSYDSFAPRLDEPTFADNLTTLTFEGHTPVFHYMSLLPLFSNLQRLNIFANVTGSVRAAEFVGMYKSIVARDLEPPLSTSLQCVRAERLQKFASEERWAIYTDFPRTATEEVSLYRNLILDLVCRVPSVRTLMVSEASLEGVRKSIDMLAKPGVGPEHMSHIRCVGVPVVEEHYMDLGGD
ncbi:hypothetical protein IWW39_002220 [Coemansia spiralis]|uniref:Uncharacterized protein n=1 Tax=Coemansia spiralis TaxID=417178 RepID=A0A9W8GLE1_9FUNG|nr:hypothetical protein IWW39_002220 [Coemansia spiralis]